jgi:glycosyltransferase involved in cell wall biosynthesis
VTQYDISVILPFQDHEDIIGTAVAEVARYLREQGSSFEIVAVDDDSGDNSQAVLALIRARFPELRVLGAPGRGRGHEWGAHKARGAVLWFIEPGHALATLAQFAQAHERVRRGEKDLIAVEQGYLVVHRARCWQAVKGVRGQLRQFRRRLLWRASRRGLQMDIPAPRRILALRWAAPLVAALSLSRTS